MFLLKMRAGQWIKPIKAGCVILQRDRGLIMRLLTSWRLTKLSHTSSFLKYYPLWDRMDVLQYRSWLCYHSLCWTGHRRFGARCWSCRLWSPLARWLAWSARAGWTSGYCWGGLWSPGTHPTCWTGGHCLSVLSHWWFNEWCPRRRRTHLACSLVSLNFIIINYLF